MNALLFLRRTHLYLGMVFIPWMILFGLSSLPLNHAGWNRPVTFTAVDDREFQLDLPPDADLREIGRRMLQAAGFSGGFYVSRPAPSRVTVNYPTFRDAHRIVYDMERRRLTVEKRSNLPFLQRLGSMHTRSGFALGSSGNSVWAWLVDVFCVGLLLWILTGLLMWWQLRGAPRRWGWVALAGGVVCFAALAGTL